MDVYSLLAVAFGLSMDAFSVSVASGISGKCNQRSTAFKMAFSFGAFQAIMPTLGWFVGNNMLNVISEVDHWIAFALLFLVGFKMVCGSTGHEFQRREEKIGFYTLLLLSIATSIDALAVGVSFAFLKISIFYPVIIIGAVTFALALVGVTLGDRVKVLSPGRIEIVGGIVLMVIGIKILTEHLA